MPADLGTLRGSLISRRVEDQQDGILATIVGSIAADLRGATKAGAALAFSPFAALGAEVPISFDDLETRDWVGAASVASMFVGGFGLSVARSVAAGQGLRGAAFIGSRAGQRAAATFAGRATAAQRALQLAKAEAAAGAFFGSVKPLEQGEDRLEEVLSDATFFGVAGGGLSMLGSAWKATFGARLAAMKGDTGAAIAAGAAQRSNMNRQLAEFAGVSLRNPETGTIQRIHRLADGTVRVFDGATSSEASEFGAAVARALETGYTENLGVSRTKLTETLKATLPEDMAARLAETGGDVSALIDANSFANYKAVKEVLGKFSEQDGFLDWLSAEAITPLVNDFGVADLSSSVGRKFRQDVLDVLPKPLAKRLATLPDAEFLREATLAGAVDIDATVTGAEFGTLIDELVYNGAVPTQAIFAGRTASHAGVPADIAIFSARNPYDATVLSMLATPRTIAKLHPEIEPLTRAGSAAAERQALGESGVKDFIHNLRNEIPRGTWERGVEIIEASAAAGGVRAARNAAVLAARESGDPRLALFVERTTDRLNMERLKLIAAGRLGGSEADAASVAQARQIIGKALQAGTSDAAEDAALRSGHPVVIELLDDAGLAGYFPIVNTGSIQAQRAGEAAPAFFNAWGDAVRFVAEGGNGGFIANAMTLDNSVARTVSPKEFGRLVKTVQEANGFTLSAEDAANALREAGTVPSAGPRKFSKHLLQRKLGLRDYAEDPVRALDFYLSNINRTLAWNTFEREANSVIEAIPAAKNGLKAWAEHQRDLMLGRPTAAEKMVAKVVTSIAPEVSQASLRRYSSMVRQAQGLLKLGGFWSGIVNATQFVTNSVALLGPKYAAIGLEAFFNPAHKRRIEALLAKHEVSIGAHVSLTSEGELIGAEQVGKELSAVAARLKIGEGRAAVGAGLQALENMWMFSFNAAERMNRLGTFWGAFKKGSAEGMDEAAAVAYAKDLTLRTQFDYSKANLPQALQGPVASVLGQFKTFFINEIELIAGMTNAERAKLMLTFQVLGGAGAILALPGVDLTDAASRHFFDVKASEAIKLEGGREDAPALSRFAAFGLPGFKGVDLTNYIGPGGFDTLTMGLLGPTVSDITAWGAFFGEALRDVKTAGGLQAPTVNAWMQKVMPAQLRRIQRGVLIGSGRDIFRFGAEVQAPGEVRNPYSGKLLYRPADRVREAWRTSLGIPEMRVEMNRMKDDIVTRETEAHRVTRESFRRQIALAMLAGQMQEANRLRVRAHAVGIVFTPSDLKRAVDGFSKDAGERRAGRTPRALRTEFEDLYGSE